MSTNNNHNKDGIKKDEESLYTLDSSGKATQPLIFKDEEAEKLLVPPFVAVRPRALYRVNMIDDTPKIISPVMTSSRFHGPSIAFLREYADGMREITKGKVADLYVTDAQPYSSDGSMLRNLAGYKTLPRPVSEYNNQIETKPLKEDMEVLNGVWRMLARLATQRMVATSPRINPDSNMGAPLFEHDGPTRLAAMYNIIDNWAEYKSLVESEQHYELAERFGRVSLMVTGSREQPEKIAYDNGEFVPRIRSLYDGDEFVQAERSVNGLSDFYTIRVRPVNGGAHAFNDVANMWCTTMLNSLVKTFPQTLHTRGALDFEEQLLGYTGVVAADKPAADLSMSRHSLKTVIDAMHISDYVKKELFSTILAPILSTTNRGQAFKRLLLYGDPANPLADEHLRFPGMPSGHAIVALANKLVYLGEQIFIAIKTFGLPTADDPAFWIRTLRGEHEWLRLWNHGDDMAFGIVDTDPSEPRFNKLLTQLEKYDDGTIPFPHGGMGLETPAAFTGFLVKKLINPFTGEVLSKDVHPHIKKEGVTKVFTCVQRMNSFNMNRFVPEVSKPDILVEEAKSVHPQLTRTISSMQKAHLRGMKDGQSWRNSQSKEDANA